MPPKPSDERWPDLAGRLEGGRHRLPIRVYYEDTDFSGFVYHANYLKFCERARSDWLRLIGLHHHELMEREEGAGGGLGFVVRRLTADFLKPAVMDDVLEVVTDAVALTRARLTLSQTILRGEERLFVLTVTVAVVDRRGRPRRLPQQLLDSLS
ncbi:tol-pal system-associated acyl-CoA thioesterase [Rhodoligotrophos defluvii]|uniref:tol-pal system-associated acyl-CoA thioesterase n=1 Tax=Rhodoligotrophos defluvii TaxID=2561934 RepID=UPI0010CA1863|nr:tol-pal system-associated acyl-CoA thioesterase [Rhodoligotrophos defluvii]